MYQITIKTKYNVIHLNVEDYNTPEMQEIFEQPYVEEIVIEHNKVKKLVKKNDKIIK